MLTHPANLAVQSLHQCYAKYKTTLLHHFALFGHGAKYRNAPGHAFNKGLGDGLVDGYNIFLFVVVASSKDFIDQVAVAGHEYQPLRILVEAPDRKNASAVANKTLDIVSFRIISGAYDAHWFVQGDKHQVFFRSGLNDLAVYSNGICG